MMWRLKVWGGALFAALLALLAFGRAKKKEGRNELQNEFEQETSRRVQAGREAVRAGRHSGLNPSDRVRANDDKWRGL